METKWKIATIDIASKMMGSDIGRSVAQGDCLPSALRTTPIAGTLRVAVDFLQSLVCYGLSVLVERMKSGDLTPPPTAISATSGISRRLSATTKTAHSQWSIDCAPYR
jgi:hypothetical protein